jgi:glycerol-3-phosphate dehydrogenase subunit B
MTAPSMSEKVDVVVIGGGAAGLMAGASARAQGASVLVVKHADGATAMSSGAVDVADADRALVPSSTADAFATSDVRIAMERLVKERPRHPYARIGEVGRARLDEALALFGSLARGVPLVKRADGKNLVVVSALGTTKRTALASAAVDLSAKDVLASPIAIVAPQALAGFDAVDVRRTLSYIGSLTGRALEIVELIVEHPFKGAPATPLDFSRKLDVHADERDRLVDAIVEAVRTENASRESGSKIGVILLPVPLGVMSAESARRAIEERTATKTGELLSVGLGAPGLRLSEALEAGARERDVEIVRGRAIGATEHANRVQSVNVDRFGVVRAVHTGAVVLASGRFLSGGFTDEGIARDTVFGLPVVTDGVPIDDRFIGDLVGARPSAEHAILRAGLVVDEMLRPRTRDGALAALNLFAAGSVIEGYDPARDGSGLGVALLTGFLAGEAAARAARLDTALADLDERQR